MRYLAFLVAAVLFTSLAAAAFAATTDHGSEGDPPCCGVDIGPAMPVKDPAHGAWRDRDAVVPGQSESAASGKVNGDSATITVTAVVLPGRTIYVSDSGDEIRILGNTTGPAWWSVRDVNDRPLELSERIWAAARSCMAHAERERGELCTEPLR
jgi:hypothetical protein